MGKHDHLYNEVAADALMAADEEMAWERSRDLDLGLEPGCVSTDEMQARWAADRAEVMADYEPREWGWWERAS